MRITKEQYKRIRKHFPVPRGNVRIGNYRFLHALLYVVENGCKWRALPRKYGKWNSVYQKAKRWQKSGVLQRIFIVMQKEKILSVKIEILALDSTSIKLHPDAHGALKKEENSPLGNQKEDGTPNFIWYPLMIKSL